MAFEKAINEKTKAVIVNTPNNPTGVIYHEETMKKMAEILEKKEKEIGHEIYLISDEPYRELVYDGNQEDFLTKYYRNTIVGYSFSKSLSFRVSVLDMWLFRMRWKMQIRSLTALLYPTVPSVL